MQKNKKLIIIALVLFSVAISMVIFLLSQKNKTKAPTITNTNPETAIVDATADWATYTDQKYKFSIKYPSFLIVKNKTSSSIMIDSQELIAWIESVQEINKKELLPLVGINVYDSISQLDQNSSNLDDFIKKSKDKIETTSINGVDGYLCTSSNLNKYIYVQNNNLIYKIYFDTHTNRTDIQKTIIDSIRFN